MKKMKNNKAAGEDGVVIEFMKALPREELKELTEILNEFWKNGEIETGWEVGRIFPIHKAGDTGKASNYRGVSLLNAGYKLLASIITGPLKLWLEGTGILKESQVGFKNGRGTRDHIVVFNSTIKNKLKKKRGKLFTAFVDFKAAYDTVGRDIMMEKLRKTRIKGRLYRSIGKIYEDTVNEVITNEGMTERFRTARGVREGCPFTPLLLSLFIDDLDEICLRQNEVGSVIGKEKIFAMKFG